MGLPFLSLMDALEGAEAKPDILKLGVVYPVARSLVRDFTAQHKEVKVLEELDNILERDVKAIAFEENLTTKIVGKLDQEDWIGEYTADKVYAVLSTTWPDLLPRRKIRATQGVLAPARPAQLCPGCGHRSAFYAIKQALSATDITVADIGCHTLGYLPPYEMGQLLMCMGASPGMGSGLSLFNDSRKVVAFMGDSTFFHAGLPAIVNAVFNQHNITLILMENGTTAMTGHQDHPATGRNFNDVTEKIPVRSVLEGLGVQHIYEVDTYQQNKLKALVAKAVDAEGFSAVIARHPCMLKFTREQRRRKGYRSRRVSIDQKACDRSHACVAAFGCPTFTRLDDGRVAVNADLCIGDGSCIQTCPTAAINPMPTTADK
jgi:indolepyruvate ferredoxin oxidoreductase alpha subunit